MSELSLIAAFEELLRPRSQRIVRWLGDDAAVVRARPFAVTSVDAMVDGVHFRLDHPGVTAADAGHRALAAALSDLAAMGAEAGEAYVAMGVPEGLGPEARARLRARDGGAGRAHGDHDRRRRPRARARADAGGDGHRLGGHARGARRARRRAARRRRRRHRRAGRPRPRGSPCSTAARSGGDDLVRAYLRPEPRLAEGRALARARRPRDDRPLRRPGHRRAPPRARAAAWRSRSTSMRCRSRRAWPRSRASSASSRGSWRRPAARTSSCARAWRADAQAPGTTRWAGWSAGEPGVTFSAGGAARALRGYEHRVG